MHDQAKRVTGALASLRVLNFVTFIAAPYAATLMAEFGADVVKVELPGSGDPTRRFGSITDAGETLPWLSEACNKRSIALDLRTAEGGCQAERRDVALPTPVPRVARTPGADRWLGGLALDADAPAILAEWLGKEAAP
jgi:hypothetical protein